MPRKPNYSFARSQREQAKAAKKLAKEEAKQVSARGETEPALAEPAASVDLTSAPQRD